VSRELRRNADGLGGYRATSAHALAYHRASRPKPAKLLTNLRLRGMVEADLAKKYSPEQIAGRLKVEFPDQPEMQVSTETIYQSLYVQSRGALKQELTRCLRTGRAVRRPSRKVGQRKNRIPNMINISERSAEADDRAVPGHWEGDLIIGRKNLSAIGTLVERTTNYTMLLHLPDGYTPELVRDASSRLRKLFRGAEQRPMARQPSSWRSGCSFSPHQRHSPLSPFPVTPCDGIPRQMRLGVRSVS